MKSENSAILATQHKSFELKQTCQEERRMNAHRLTFIIYLLEKIRLVETNHLPRLPRILIQAVPTASRYCDYNNQYAYD